jgi:hypothetical protein
MKIKSFLPLLVLALVVSVAAQARTNENSTLAQAYGSKGREVAAPPWSAACMTDHGPSQCGEPMWVYGSPVWQTCRPRLEEMFNRPSK